MWRYPAILISTLALVACASRPPAPVGERSAPVVVESGAARGAAAAPANAPAGPREGYYVVKKGDTLRRIAAEHGQDWRDVAAWNNLTDPGKIEIGQELRIVAPEGAAVVKPVQAPAPLVVMPDSAPGSPVPAGANTGSLKHEPKGGKVAYSDNALAMVQAMEGGSLPVAKPAEKPAEKPVEKPAAATAPAPEAAGIDWTWPAAGKVVGEFVEGTGGKESNKGIDLAGRMGEPIQAAAAGKVTYVGNLRGYGDFVVVRHNNDYISVYAHTSKILVKKDQTVAKGQKIAEIGNSDADQTKLHFEIRQQSRPIDPLKLLPAR